MDRPNVKGSTKKTPANALNQVDDFGRVAARHALPKSTPEEITHRIIHESLPKRDIVERQRRIHEEVLHLSRSMDSSNFSRIDSDDLRRMSMLYDREFFDSQLLAMIGRDRLRYGFSSRMTRVAGKLVTHYPARRKSVLPRKRSPATDDRKYEMILSSTLLFQAFSDVDRPIIVTGLRCRDRLEAMQRVCEHEFVHLLETFFWNDSSCSGDRFQGIANRFFGHTEHRHDLITQSERAARNFDVRVGSVVRFRHDGSTITGWVNRITRRATVLVEDTRGERFDDGKSYLRFYVPLEKLQLVQPRGHIGRPPQTRPW